MFHMKYPTTLIQLACTDLATSIAFYGELGFEFQCEPTDEHPDRVVSPCGSGTIELWSGDPGSSQCPALSVDDVVNRAGRAGGHAGTVPRTLPRTHGDLVAVVDPDGREVLLWEYCGGEE